MAVIIRKGQYYGTGDVTMYSTAPIGTIMAFAGSTVPDTYLLCDGTSYEISKYPDLYAAIGTTYGQVDDTHFNVPDLRETVLVGVGTRASGVATHDTYTLGQFKDDQLQQHRHYRFSNDENGASYAGTGGTGYWTPTSSSGDYGSETGHISVGRAGSTTHGKQMGINYIIKYKLHPNSSSSGDPESDTNLDYWIGTRAEWMALSANEKLQYTDCIVCFTDEAQTGVVLDSAVVQGSENPVTGDAVYNAINTVNNAVNTVNNTVNTLEYKSAPRYKVLTFNTIPGVTFSCRDNNPKGLSATRIGNMVILNYSINVSGTYTSTSGWKAIFDWSQLNDLLDEGETIPDYCIPYFSSGITYPCDANNKLDGVMSGCYLYFYNSAVFNMGIQGQIIVGVV